VAGDQNQVAILFEMGDLEITEAIAKQAIVWPSTSCRSKPSSFGSRNGNGAGLISRSRAILDAVPLESTMARPTSPKCRPSMHADLIDQINGLPRECSRSELPAGPRPSWSTRTASASRSELAASCDGAESGSAPLSPLLIPPIPTMALKEGSAQSQRQMDKTVGSAVRKPLAPSHLSKDRSARTSATSPRRRHRCQVANRVVSPRPRPLHRTKRLAVAEVLTQTGAN